MQRPGVPSWWPAVGCAVAAATLMALVLAGWTPLVAVDQAVALSLHRHALAHALPTLVNRALSDWVWDPSVLRLLTAGVAAALWWRGQRRRAWWVLGTLAAAGALNNGLKLAVGRPRPQWIDPVDSAPHAAWPSGHALTAAVVFGLLVWILWDRVPVLVSASVAVVSVLGVGFTRLYLGVHWLSDVLGGWLLGSALVLSSVRLFARGRPGRASERSGRRAETSG
ncbi:phosphatase PAP2 family protein [Streptomyces sp. NPDC006879]|uniref:phosphatase PAP2 family protein n=1 Tax=Streptomyces sp. NPDC006879 TaxID=3364767 RepID=UPI00368A4823